MFEPKGRVRAGAWAKKRMQRAENTACFHTHLIKTERTVEMYEWVANDYLTVSKEERKAGFSCDSAGSAL